MFQTSRSMVFADGVPLHYLLQSRWNGAPRWTMVSASEIAQVETLMVRLVRSTVETQLAVLS